MSKSAALLFALIFLTGLFIGTRGSVSAVDLGSWATEAPIQEARSELGVAVVDGKIYAIGGSTFEGSWPYNGGVVGTNEEYDPETKTWRFKKPMPTPRTDFGIVVYNNKIYCIGGVDSESITNVNEVYDPSTDTWETREPMPTPRYGVRANVVNGKIYLLGGYDPDVSIDWGASTHNEAYDPETDSWSTKTPIPHPTSNYASAVFDDKIYVIGGFIGMGGAREGAEALHFELNQVYDTETDSWSYLAPLTQGYGGVTGGVTAGFMAPRRIYVFGEMRNGFGENSYFSVRVYDPESDSWTAGANIPTQRGGFGVAVLNDIFYVIGGRSSDGAPFPLSLYADPPILRNYALNQQYTPFDYGTIPPVVSIISPENKTYASSNVSLAFTVDKSVAWVGYSLDEQDNVTVTGNITINELSNGLHYITVYANDTFGNIGTSETITFTVTEEPEPFPTVLVATASGASAAFIAIGLLVYFKKHKH